MLVHKFSRPNFNECSFVLVHSPITNNFQSLSYFSLLTFQEKTYRKIERWNMEENISVLVKLFMCFTLADTFRE